MGLKGLSVGARMDGSVDVDVEDEEGWNTSNLGLPEAEFLHEELGRAIARQKERGFPKLPEPPKLPDPGHQCAQCEDEACWEDLDIPKPRAYCNEHKPKGDRVVPLPKTP